MSKQKRKLLITGNGRSGTLTMVHALRTLDLDIGHEYVRDDGTVSLYFFDPKVGNYPYIPWGPPKGLNAHVGQHMKDYKFEHIFHQIRHPLLCIPSMAMIYSRPIMDWFESEGVVPEGLKPRLRKSMHIWYEVNKRAEKLTDQKIRIEEIKKVDWGILCDVLGVDPVPFPRMKPKHRATKSRKRIVKWEDLRDLDSKLTWNIKKMAAKYGYTK